MSVGKKTAKIAPCLWDFVNALEDQATSIGNIHKNLVKIAYVVREISSRTGRSTDTHNHAYYNTSLPLPWAK